MQALGDILRRPERDHDAAALQAAAIVAAAQEALQHHYPELGPRARAISFHDGVVTIEVSHGGIAAELRDDAGLILATANEKLGRRYNQRPLQRLITRFH